MSSFEASATANGRAYTSTNPSYLVTSNASASATSALSEENAQEEATKLAEFIALSAAQNDANIISQTIKLSPTGILGTFTNLNLNFTIYTSIRGMGEFNGIIVQSTVDSSGSNYLALNLTSKKSIYKYPGEELYPNSDHLSSISLNAINYGGNYGSVTIRGVTYTSATAKSVLNCNRISSIDIPVNNIIYKIKIISNLKYFCNIPVLPSTSYSELNSSITGIQVNDKALSSVNIISNESSSGELITTYAGVYLSETYTNDYTRNNLFLDFSKAYISGSSKNVYPVINPDAY